MDDFLGFSSLEAMTLPFTSWHPLAAASSKRSAVRSRFSEYPRIIIGKILFYSFFCLYFIDYLYRVESYHSGTSGSAQSEWIFSRSGQGGKYHKTCHTRENATAT